VLAIGDLSVFYGKIRALNKVSLDVQPGEVFALIGPNGAGKTTLLRAIMGVVPCRGGSIAFSNYQLAGQPAHTRARVGISIVPEGRGLFSEFTVEENLLAGAFVRSDAIHVKMDLERIYHLFPKLKERRRQLANTLSGGEGQMLALGRALMSCPKLLLLDEPSMGLMPIVVNEIFDTIASLKQERISILLVEQSAKKALSVADRVGLLQLGCITTQGATVKLLDNEQVKRAYFGA
jgi:branched-chain amino acid transport system ATP-binding protein